MQIAQNSCLYSPNHNRCHPPYIDAFPLKGRFVGDRWQAPIVDGRWKRTGRPKTVGIAAISIAQRPQRLCEVPFCGSNSLRTQ